jgi:hypothetical protein
LSVAAASAAEVPVTEAEPATNKANRIKRIAHFFINSLLSCFEIWVEIASQFRRDYPYLQQNNRLDVNFRRRKKGALVVVPKRELIYPQEALIFNKFHKISLAAGPATFLSFPFWNSLAA